MKKKLLIIFIILITIIVGAVAAKEIHERKNSEENSMFGGYDLNKPVIYLYPTKPTNVSVKLDLDGILSCTYPKYNNGWNVKAMPDGTLYDTKGMQYDYLFWEGKSEYTFDFSTGYCVKGEDTESFLETKLEELGLNRHEANDFITYWLPKMEGNKYNIISFQTKAYTDHAKLNISPNPDTMIRVFMTYKASDIWKEMKEEKIDITPVRSGFTVVEWGGAECK